MHPELLNNSLFLRYYQQWQQDPSSLVFAPMADFLLRVDKTEEAIRICLTGLNHHPEFISGRLVLAKAFIQKKDFERAKEELRRVLAKVPNQEKARELLALIEVKRRERPAEAPHWETLTMAKIYAAQGHLTQAREVCRSILKREPQNAEAQLQLAQWESEA